MVSNKTNRSYGEHDLDMEVTSQGQIVIVNKIFTWK